MAERLVTSRYVPPGAYIGQLIVPKPGNLTADARICNYIGKGSRLAKGSNLGIRRSFVFGENLTFPISAPFESPLIFAADGNKTLPVRVFDSVTGVELREDQWSFVKVGSDFKKVLISQSAFDNTASYRIDYQSTSRAVLDPLPFDDIRAIQRVGTSPDRAEFEDFVSFFVPYDFSGPTADSSNSTVAPFLTSIFPDAGNTGAGAVAIDVAADYNHDYNRFYELEVTAISGASGSFTADFDWSSRRYSGGLEAEPPTPLHSTATKPTFTALEATPASLVQELEFGIKVAITFDATNFAIGDKFYFNGVGPGLVEFDGRFSNTNQFTEFGTIVGTPQPGSTGDLSYATDNQYTGTRNTKFRIEVTASAGAPGARTVGVVWAQYGEDIGATSLATIAEATSLDFTLTNGVKLTVDFGASNFAVGDVFDFEIKAPRLYYQAKDDRILKLTVSSATNPGADAGIVTGAYESGTIEGSFGTWTSEVNLLTGASAKDGYFELQDGVYLAVRNAMRGNINGTSYVTGDVFQGSITSEDVIDWSLSTQVEEVRETPSFLVDITGQVTGTSGTTYVILDNVPDAGTIDVVEELSGSPVSFVEIPGTRFLAFVTAPTVSVLISYTFRGEEPAPGQLYYITSNYVRPAALFNVPTLVLDRDDGRLFLAPSETENHLYIMNEIVFDNGAPGAYYTQARDQDGDGLLTVTDMAAALNAHEQVSRITDLCVLSHFDSLSNALAANERGNDPFEKREQMLWVGTPIGTPIGDLDTPESLVFLARSTLQVPPKSPAQGTRVLVAPTQSRRLILLDSGLDQEVILDGSFVAGGASARVNSFSDPSSTVLRTNLSGFTFVQTYSDPENRILGGASITWLTDQGNGVFRFEEDITVHTSAEEFQLISATTQKQFVTRVVRREMDNSLVALVPPNAQSAIGLIRSSLAIILLGLGSRGLIADYQDEDGNIRSFDPNSDIVVLRRTGTLTEYDFFYAYFIKAPIKRLFGLFAVNTNDFGLGNT